MQGIKNDQGKTNYSLLVRGMPEALEAVAKVLTSGAEKYSIDNWKHVPDAGNRYLSASMRHEVAFQKGEMLDKETGLHHLAHKICSDLFRLQMELSDGGPAETGVASKRKERLDAKN